MSDNYDSVAGPIGTQIRELRLARGWSLVELAGRAGTSAPTLHRYENGWDRFEVATLRKLAAALGARLEIRLVPSGAGEPGERPIARRVVRVLAALFWDRELTASDLDEYPRWVLGRVLMFGDVDQVAAARGYYGDDAIREAVAHRSVDARTRNYWNVVLPGR